MTNIIKNKFILMLAIISISQVACAMMTNVSRQAPAIGRAAAPAIGAMMPSILSNYNRQYNSPESNEYNFTQKYSPSGQSQSSMPNLVQQYANQPYSQDLLNQQITAYQNTQAKQRPIVDLKQAFAHDQTDENSYNPWTDQELGLDSMDDTATAQPQLKKLNPNISIAQNLYGRNSGFGKSPFNLQQRNYSTFKPESEKMYSASSLSNFYNTISSQNEPNEINPNTKKMFDALVIFCKPHNNDNDLDTKRRYGRSIVLNFNLADIKDFLSYMGIAKSTSYKDSMKIFNRIFNEKQRTSYFNVQSKYENEVYQTLKNTIYNELNEMKNPNYNINDNNHNYNNHQDLHEQIGGYVISGEFNQDLSNLNNNNNNLFIDDLLENIGITNSTPYENAIKIYNDIFVTPYDPTVPYDINNRPFTTFYSEQDYDRFRAFKYIALRRIKQKNSN